MKISTVALLAFASSRARAQTPCITGSFSVTFHADYNEDEDIDYNCDYTNLLEAFEIKYEDMIKDPGCTNTAEEELKIHLLASEPTAASVEEATINICKIAWNAAAAASIPFDNILRECGGPQLPECDSNFTQIYYNGGTYLNEEIETKYGENGLNERSNHLRTDGERIREFFESEAQNTRVEWPGTLTNFHLPSCTANAAMCCWTQDRQANDGNGNCNREYDINCVDKDPADNTDLCYMDLSVGSLSNEFASDQGSVIFPGGNNDGEGPIHCHGFAWADDEGHKSFRYMANNLFFVSMYDHLHQRGYVREVPGAPMCACVEQMPVVSRSDCTEIQADETYTFVFNSQTGKFTASVELNDINFASCQGYNNQNNDLWAYQQELYFNEKVTPSAKLAKLAETLVEDNNCPYAVAEHFDNDRGLATGYIADDVWVQVAGRDSLYMESFVQHSFELLAADAPQEIMMLRMCLTCDPELQRVVYKRITPYPNNPANPTLDLLNHLKNGNNEVDGNVYGTDFLLYPSLEDALADTNEFECADYNYGAYFPGNCAPGGTTNGGEYSRFEWPSGRMHVAWYLYHPTALTFGDESDVALYNLDRSPSTITLESENIGGVNHDGEIRVVNGTTYFITASGNDIWNNADQFHYVFEEFPNGPVTATVCIRKLRHRDNWTKAGLMIRNSTDPSAGHASVFLFGVNGVGMHYRKTHGDRTYSEAIDYNDRENVCLMITKEGDKITTFASDEENPLNWYVVAEEEVVLSSDTLLVGMAITSHNTNALAEVEMDSLEIEFRSAGIVCSRVYQ